MATIVVENIIKLFINDTHICAVNGLQLMKYQMEKHDWTYQQWNEYYQIYRNNLNNIGLKEISDGREKLTYEERVGWFVYNFYETGMEYEAMLDDMKDKDLDNYQWYGDTIKIPKYKDEI